MIYKANITESALTEQATARARVLVEITNRLGGLELTDEDRKIVMAGVQMGIAACVSTLRAVSVEQSVRPPEPKQL